MTILKGWIFLGWIFLGWIFFRGEYFSGVNPFQGWIFLWWIFFRVNIFLIWIFPSVDSHSLLSLVFLIFWNMTCAFNIKIVFKDTLFSLSTVSLTKATYILFEGNNYSVDISTYSLTDMTRICCQGPLFHPQGWATPPYPRSGSKLEMLEALEAWRVRGGNYSITWDTIMMWFFLQRRNLRKKR